MKRIKKIAAVLLAVCFMMLLSVVSVSAINESADHSYMVDDDYNQNTIPKTYKFSFSLSEEYEGVRLATPEDMFIATDDTIYIADTANNRIVHLAADGTFIRTFKNGFNSPKGVFADKDGNVYVADTNNKRIVKLSASGEFIKEFTRPESDLLSDDISYEPTKLIVCDNGLIYVIIGKEFMSITQDNVFMGYLGSEPVPFSLTNMFVNMFASDVQKQLLTKVQPSAYNNFTLSDDGIVYAVANKSTGQIKKITSVGENIYEEKFYGEYVFNQSNVLVPPFYSDIAVDKDGIIFACESNSRKIYQYDQKGNSIAVFGGEGTTDGYFSMPTAVDVNSRGEVFVLDSDRGTVQVFVPTRFMSQVLSALNLFSGGEYEKAYTAWSEITEQNAGYPLAHDMLGAIEYKQKDYRSSMEHYKISGNQEKYGEAYGKLLHSIITKNFALVAIGVIVFVFAAFYGLSRLKKTADKWNRQLFRIDTEGE